MFDPWLLMDSEKLTKGNCNAKVAATALANKIMLMVRARRMRCALAVHAKN